MKKLTSSICVSTALTMLVCGPVVASDARSIALGGSVIANGQGVHGALENPSSLMRMNRQQQRLHLHLGFSLDARDDAGLVEAAGDEDSLADDLESEIDALSGRALTCDFTSAPEDVCLTGTQRLAELSTTVLDILNRADNKPVQATASFDFGVAYTTWSVPAAVHFRSSVTGAGLSDIADEDFNYIGTFATVLEDDQLTFDELTQSVPLTISDDGQTLSVLPPEEALQSEGEGSYLLRAQFGVSLATSVQYAGYNIDLGMTPKFSSLRAASLTASFGEQFNDNIDTIADRIEENETTGSSFTVDLGASTVLNELPLHLSVVARNLIKESIKTNEGFLFETTPQMILGAAYSFNSALTLSGDLALNKAKLDNLETQVIAVGIELSRPLLGIRAGISHDNARDADATALSLGFTAGPLHFGARMTDANSAQLGAQLAYSF